MNSLRKDAIWIYLHPCLSRLVERTWRRGSYETRVGIKRNGGGYHIILSLADHPCYFIEGKEAIAVTFNRGYGGFAMNDLFYIFSFEDIYFGFQ